MRPARLLVVAVLIAVAPVHAPAAMPQSPAHAQTADTDVYEKFRAWIGSQPREAQEGDPLEAYRKVLTAAGVPAAEVERQLRVIDQQGQRLEIDRWNRILTSPKPAFNVKPNAFLVEMVRGVTPGQALDVGMGQGRNAIYLAQQGWALTGFDPGRPGRRRGPAGGQEQRCHDHDLRAQRRRVRFRSREVGPHRPQLRRRPGSDPETVRLAQAWRARDHRGLPS